MNRSATVELYACLCQEAQSAISNLQSAISRHQWYHWSIGIQYPNSKKNILIVSNFQMQSESSLSLPSEQRSFENIANDAVMEVQQQQQNQQQDQKNEIQNPNNIIVYKNTYYTTTCTKADLQDKS